MDQVYQIKQVLSARAALQTVPISGAFELTPRCNFRCKMCYIRMTPQQMTAIGRERTALEWLEMGRQARDAGLLFLLLTGGEPFLRPDFEEIYTGLTKMGLSISINTNGSLLDDGLRALFRRLPPAMVNVTVYGASAAGYETLCGDGAGSAHRRGAGHRGRDQHELLHGAGGSDGLLCRSFPVLNHMGWTHDTLRYAQYARSAAF